MHHARYPRSNSTDNSRGKRALMLRGRALNQCGRQHQRKPMTRPSTDRHRTMSRREGQRTARHTSTRQIRPRWEFTENTFRITITIIICIESEVPCNNFRLDFWVFVMSLHVDVLIRAKLSLVIHFNCLLYSN